MWSNCKIEKLHAIILQAKCGDVKGRTNDDALCLLEDFLSAELQVTRTAAHPPLFSFPSSLCHNATINPALRGLMLQGSF